MLTPGRLRTFPLRDRFTGAPIQITLADGVQTSGNPLEAFKQGLRQEPRPSIYHVAAWRCETCAGVFLYADEPLTTSQLYQPERLNESFGEEPPHPQ
jgi:hypothetical protein